MQLSLSEWIPALTTTGLLSALIFLCRNLILERLRKSVEHEYGKKMQLLRAELRESGIRLETELASRDKKFSELRGTAIAAIGMREQSLVQRRIEAVDQLWANVHKLRPAKGALKVMAPLSYEAVSSEIESDRRLVDVMKTMLGEPNFEILADVEAHASRPYLSDTAWALYQAYQAICGAAIGRHHMLVSGIDGRRFLDEKGVSDLLKVVFPEHDTEIEENGHKVHHLFVDRLEVLLVEQLRADLRGESSDIELVARTSKILDHANILEESTKASKGGDSSAA